MKYFIKLNIYTLIVIVLFSSCAGSYNAIRPNQINYTGHSHTNDINFSYKYDVLLERRNRRYSKKEYNKGVRLVAVKITNNTNREIVVKDDLAFTANEQKVFPMEPMVMKQSLRQLPATHLLYLLLSPITIYSADNNGNVQSAFPIGLIFGVGLAVGNLLLSSNANKNLVAEYSKENILNKKVEPGETITGLMAFKAFGSPSLAAFVIKSEQKITQ